MPLIKSLSWSAFRYVRENPSYVEHVTRLFEAAAAFSVQVEGEPLMYPLGSYIGNGPTPLPGCIAQAKVLTLQDDMLVAKGDYHRIFYLWNHAMWKSVAAYLLEDLRRLHQWASEGETSKLDIGATMSIEFKTANKDIADLDVSQVQAFIAAQVRESFSAAIQSAVSQEEASTREWGNPRDPGPRWAEAERPGRIDPQMPQNPCGEVFAGSLGTVPTTVPTTYSSDDIDPAVHHTLGYHTTGVVIRDGVAVPVRDGERPTGYVVSAHRRGERQSTREQAINLLIQNAALLRERGIRLDTSTEEEEPEEDTSGDFIEAVVASHDLTTQDASAEGSDDNQV